MVASPIGAALGLALALALGAVVGGSVEATAGAEELVATSALLDERALASPRDSGAPHPNDSDATATTTRPFPMGRVYARCAGRCRRRTSAQPLPRCASDADDEHRRRRAAHDGLGDAPE